GFPPDHCQIKEHIDEILQSHLGDEFSESGVGKDWTKHFISDHNDQIRPYWSKGLDHSRATAVNPTTKWHYYELLTMVIEGKGGNDIIPPELIFGVDKSGFQKGMGKCHAGLSVVVLLMFLSGSLLGCSFSLYGG
ncbi:hypothetical protein BJV74DRAFT_787919, partial [Russula compacta]